MKRMFRQWAKQYSSAGGAAFIFNAHPSYLIDLLEYSWDHRSACCDQKFSGGYQGMLALSVGSPINRCTLKGADWSYNETLNPQTGTVSHPYASFPPVTNDGHVEFDKAFVDSLCYQKLLWDHLIYAYMIENTRIYEIFQKVLFEYLHGEKYGSPSFDTQNWLRNTEELFYRDPPSFSITTLTSKIRSDLRASRRNAYQRMFGMDLNHGTDKNQPYPYTRADAANNEFISTFEEFLREVWIGIVNEKNTSGANPTDDGKIANLAEYLRNMLIARRQYGMLSREEFSFVSMMSWFHLTVEFNSPIVKDLKAEAASPEQRLFKIAQRVGVPAHGLSRSYFEIASPISKVLILIEFGLFRNATDVQALYTKPPAYMPPEYSLQANMNTIITHWSLISGRDMKARKVATT